MNPWGASLFILLSSTAFASYIVTDDDKNQTPSSTISKEMILHPYTKSQASLTPSTIQHLLTDKWWVPRARLQYHGFHHYGVQYEARTSADQKRPGLYFSSRNATSFDRRMVCATDPLFLSFPGTWEFVVSSNVLVLPVVVSHSMREQQGDAEFYVEETEFQILSIDEEYLVKKVIRERAKREFSDGKVYTIRDCQILGPKWDCQQFSDYEKFIQARMSENSRSRRN